MPKKTRKRFTSQEKVAILRLHLLEHTPVSDLCDRQGIHPTMFYRWQKEFFENALPRSSPAPDAPAMPRTGGSPCWSKSSSARTKCSPNSWRNRSNEKKNLGNSERGLSSPVPP